MKIALIRQKYTPYGGAERYMARLVTGLSSVGHQVHILAAQWETGDAQEVIFHRVPIIGKPGWLKALTFSRGCRDIIERERFDVVFSLERTLRQDIYRAGDGCHRQWLIQKNMGKGALSKAWTWLNPLQLAYVMLERRLFSDPCLKAIIANSLRGKEDIVRLYGIAPEKVHVVYNGIDAVSYSAEQKQCCRDDLKVAYNVADGERRLLYVGSGFTRKGVPCIIEAAAKLKFPFRLFIVGKGKNGQLSRKARKLGIGDRVIFTGPQKDVNRFYLGCDLFIFPTLYDPFSNATLEAMASGLPIITSRFNGASELIVERRNGYVLSDPLDAGELAKSIEQHFSDPDHARIGLDAQKTASQYTMNRNVEETLRVIDMVMKSSVSS